MPNVPSFTQIQQGFANHIKNPTASPKPADIDERHMSIYRDLFFKNVLGFLSGTFPVLAEIMGEARWLAIGRDFFSNHSCKTPYFLEISREFLQYLENEYEAEDGDPEYIYELAHYEWLELYVDVEPESSDFESNVDGDVLSEVPVLSPVVEGYLYQYPVHQISLENQYPDPKTCALVVYRNRDDAVGFVEISPFTLQLLALLKEGLRTGREAVTYLLNQNDLGGHQAAYDGGIQTLEHWFKIGIIHGCEH